MKIEITNGKIIARSIDRVDTEVKSPTGRTLYKIPAPESYCGTLILCNGVLMERLEFQAERIKVAEENTHEKD